MDRQVDELCDRFEEAWRVGEKPDIRAWVPAEGPLRSAALVELACIDLEWRIDSGELVRVEECIAAFPELQNDSAALLRLVATEARLRLGREAGLSAEDFRRRFPALVELSGWDSAVSATAGASPSSDIPSTEAASDDPSAMEEAPAALGERLRLHE